MITIKIPWHKRIYALYKGETFISAGTIREISKETDKTIDFLQYMTCPGYVKKHNNSLKRLRMVLLDGDEQ